MTNEKRIVNRVQIENDLLDHGWSVIARIELEDGTQVRYIKQMARPVYSRVLADVTIYFGTGQVVLDISGGDGWSMTFPGDVPNPVVQAAIRAAEIHTRKGY